MVPVSIVRTCVLVGAAVVSEAIVTDLVLVDGEDRPCPSGYNRVKHSGLNGDLNQGAEGEYIYLCEKNAEWRWRGQGITKVAVSSSNDGQHDCPFGWEMVHHGNKNDLDRNDLNNDAGGHWVYLCYKRSFEGNPLNDIKLVDSKGKCTSDRSWELADTKRESDGDLNQKAGGKDIFVCLNYCCPPNESRYCAKCERPCDKTANQWDDSQCESWVDKNYCTKYSQWMSEFCAKSCCDA